MTHGSSEKTILRQAEMARQPIPDFIKNKPELEPGLELYLQAYLDLDGERTHSMGPSPIPTTSMLFYAQTFNFNESETDDLLFYVRAMDEKNLERIRKLQKANSK